MQIYAMTYVMGLRTTRRAKISNDVLHDQYSTLKKLEILPQDVSLGPIINLIYVVHLQAESHVARCSQWIVADEWI